MIKFEQFTLQNGLKVIVHNDKSTPLVAMNILYDVGAKDESLDKTGFAHLFEHLMFGGSVHIPSYDQPLQTVGGENNAFTTNDITNYHLTLPKQNMETGFWLESDRMLSLDFSEESLRVQRNVVIEEYKQRYLNQPYGDMWLMIRPLAYKVHPYLWPTIGKDISHIENATLQDVRDFFFHHYAPNNAIMVLAGNITLSEAEKYTKKWFCPIEYRETAKRNIPQEPLQTEARFLEVERDVPVNALYKVYHMCKKTDKDYQTSDLISDLLSNGDSSRLFQSLVKRKKLFSDVRAYIMGCDDPGLMVISGKLLKGVELTSANAAIEEELSNLMTGHVSEHELTKVKNKVISTQIFSQADVLTKAQRLAQFELQGSASLINEEEQNYSAVTPDDIHRLSNQILRPSNCSTLFYHAK